jgi:hypothetical protein
MVWEIWLICFFACLRGKGIWREMVLRLHYGFYGCLLYIIMDFFTQYLNDVGWKVVLLIWTGKERRRVS